MSYRKLLILASVVLGSAIVVIIVVARTTTKNKSIYKGNTLYSGQISDWRMFVHPHDGPVPYLEIGGATYEHVRGVSPFFLTVPETAIIVFATRRGSVATAHIVDVKTGKHIVVPKVHRTFGFTIGAGPLCEDAASVIGSDRLLLSTRSSEHSWSTTIDLSTGAIISQAETLFDKSGQPTYHWEGSSLEK